MDTDEWVQGQELGAACQLAMTTETADLFQHSTDRRLVADNSLPNYDEGGGAAFAQAASSQLPPLHRVAGSAASGAGRVATRRASTHTRVAATEAFLCASQAAP